MSATSVRRLLLTLSVLALLQIISPEQILNAQDLEERERMADDFQTVVALSVRMVNNAVDLLSEGGSAMTPAEQAAFDMIFDPSDTGQIDETFVKEVRDNLLRIRSVLESRFRVRYATDSRHCVGQRLYYTDLVSVTVCPYFLVEQNEVRKARGLVHEIAHMALVAVDRPYFVPGSEAYQKLTPRGSRHGQLPLIGRLLGEITHNDTLHHPDAYAHLSSALSGIPGKLELYLRFLPGTSGPESVGSGHFVRYH